MRAGWDGMALQPEGHFNAPMDATDAQLKELTRETKRERVDKETGRRLGWVWHRPSNAANELWDLLVYNSAALDLIAVEYCEEQLKIEGVDWLRFFEDCDQYGLYKEPRD